MPTKLFMSRSAILSYNACHRKGYLDYFYKGHGISGYGYSQPLFIGVCIHSGMEHIFKWCMENDGQLPDALVIDEAIVVASNTFESILSKRTLSKKYDEDLAYTLGSEIPFLIQALIRVYVMHRLPNFIEEYEILEVEHEEVIEDFTYGVVWLGKADGLLRRRKDNALIVLSLKTASEFPESTMRDILHDMQGVSEVFAIEKRLNSYLESARRTDLSWDPFLGLHSNLKQYLHQYLLNNPNKSIKCTASQYEYFIKGSKRNQQNGIYQYQTHLLHPYKNVTAITPGTSGLVFGTQSSTNAYEWVTRQGRLPKGLIKVNIWEHMDLENWLNMLDSLQVQPEAGHPFDKCIIAGETTLVARKESERKEWFVSTKSIVECINDDLWTLNEITKSVEDGTDKAEEIELWLMQSFYKNTSSCHDYYGEDCIHNDVCHNGVNIEDALESGYYQIRRPHHDLEVKHFIEKGYLKADEI